MTAASLRVFLVVAAASALGAAVFARTPPADNTLEVVIGSGPRAGTYKLPTNAIICLDAKQANQYTAAYKDFGAGDPKKVSQAAINIENPAATGPRLGSVLITFGAEAKRPPVEYSVSISRDNAGGLTFTRSGKDADLAFQGRTKDGIVLHLTAKCTSVTVI
jgi:hypothetical protein